MRPFSDSKPEVAVMTGGRLCKRLILALGLLPGLPFPHRDVEELARVFLQAGYEKDNVVIMTKESGLDHFDLMPTAEHIRNQFQLLLAQLKQGDSIILALAGHGVLMLVPGDKPEEKPRAKSFFCPMDANLARKQLPRFIDFDELYKGLADSPATVKLLLVDPCRNELLAQPEGRPGGIEMPAPPPPPTSVAALFSCSEKEVSWEDSELDGGHGVFFHYVIQGLTGKADEERGNGNHKVELDELYSYVKDNVVAFVAHKHFTAQRPRLLGDLGPVDLLDVSSRSSARARELGLADRAQAFLKRYCFDCHGGPNDQGTRFTSALDPRVLLARPENSKKKPFVVPGDVQGSLVWLQAGKAPYRMPPDDAGVKPGDDERKVLEEWIKAGAPFPKATGRKPLDDRIVLTRVRDHLMRTKSADREDTRGGPRRNFDQARLKRGGLITSGVSRHNRLVERHPTPFGAYWRSYDFKQSAGRGNLLEFPLGPRFPGHRFDDQAFEQAGGEVIFNLPNGLQGYMLADAKDRRLDVPAQVAIVSDRSETSGTPEIVNGLSCMACHASGMRPFRDEVRRFPAVFAEIREQVERLHPPADEMDRLLAQDEDLFLRKLDEAVGPFLRSGELANADIRELVRRINEPIGAVARQYAGDLNAESVAAELGLGGVDSLQGAIRGNPKLQELGLGPLLDNHALKRELWDAAGLSLFHRVLPEFGKGPNTKL